MGESESGGPKKPGKSTGPAPKSPKPAAKKPAKAPAKKAAKPAATKPTKVTSATAKGAASAAKKPATRTRKPAKAATPAKKARPSAPKVTPAAKPAGPLPAAKSAGPVPAPKPAAPVPAPKPAAPAAPGALLESAGSDAAPAGPVEPVAPVKPAAPHREAPSRAPAKRTVVQATAGAYFEALAARDADAAVRVWDAEGVNDIVPLGIFRGPAAIRTLLKEMFTAMPDARFTTERITADDKVAAVQWRLAGTFSEGTFQGLQPTGRRVDLRGVDCLEIVDGRIVHCTSTFDGAAYARQVGLLPPEDSGADRAIRAGFNTVTKLRRTMAKRTAR